ncbi:uncharacterized protein LOC129242683 [Anastrepha obliqua]|uniref:uncharacterized protein LOC129242683 n=1 Tax=Anastrepha obliqua TaxID=95512 RepID=UPI0024094DA7|nr:uncharacterized protein LOC129242683 [Anastrepha obliqua]
MCAFQLRLYYNAKLINMNVLTIALAVTIAVETTGYELIQMMPNAASNVLQASSTSHSNNETPPKTFPEQIGKKEEFFESNSNQPHSRRKRLVWITDDGRLALPPGTSLTFTPTIAMPLVRHPPEGFFSNVSISFPLTIDFDKLGLTDESNPLGDLPPIFTRQFGRSTGHVLGDYMARYLHYKSKRDLAAQSESFGKESPFFQIRKERQNEENLDLPRLPERFKHAFHGGERVMLYGVVEDLLGTFGINGKACLLRTICEVHSRSINHFGVFGEITKLFLTATSSPFADLIPEYVRAQEIGEGRKAPGECFPYYKECPKSIFKAAQKEKYRESHSDNYGESRDNEVIKQKLPDELNRFTSVKSTDSPHESRQIFSM